MRRTLSFIVILLGFYSVPLLAQTVSTKATKGAIETDSEANKVLSAAQKQVKNLDPETKQEIVNSLPQNNENIAILKRCGEGAFRNPRCSTRHTEFPTEERSARLDSVWAAGS